MTALTDNDRDALIALTQRLRAEEKDFQNSPRRHALHDRLAATPGRMAEAQAAYRAIHNEIEQRAVAAKALSYEVALELEVVRDRFLLELDKTDDLGAASDAARKRTDPESLLERARSEAAADVEAPQEEDVASPSP